MVSGNPLTFSRDRDIFSLEHENACYSKKKKNGATHDEVERKKHIL